MELIVNLSGDPLAHEDGGDKLRRVLDKAVLTEGGLRSAVGRLRQHHADRVIILCQALNQQHNQFGLRLLGLLSGARSVCIRDKVGGEVILTWPRFVVRDLPRFLVACLYAVIALCTVGILYLVLSALPHKGRRQRKISSQVARLGYLKTDFWHDLKAGGSVTHTREFIHAAARMGIPVDVFSVDPLIHYGLPAPVRVVAPSRLLCEFPVQVSQIEYNFRHAAAVYRAIRRRKPSALYQRNSTNNFSGVILSCLLRTPFILEFNSSSSWIARNWQHSAFSLLEAACERLNMRGAARIAVVSDALKDTLVARGVPPGKIVVNPNGVDPQRFSSAVDSTAVRERLPRRKWHIGFIGIFGQWHGVLTLASCVKHVLRECPEAHFVIIGNGSLKPDMVRILEADGVLDAVSFTGVVSHDEAPAFLNVCDVLVSPHEDMADGSVFFGSPTKIFEYMAMAKGIVASNVGQLAQILKHNDTALLIEQRQPQQLADAIVTLLKDDPLRTSLGEAARREVLTRFTWEHNVRRAVTAGQATPCGE